MSVPFLVAQTQPGGLGALFGSLALPVMIILIFYVIWFMPLRRRQKELDRLVAELKKGDKVVTHGGIFGEVARAEGSVIVLKVADNVRIRVRRSAIAGLEDQPEQRGN